MKKIYLNISQIKFPKITYGFFTRVGGYSKNNYESLNCSYTSGDDLAVVKKNIDRKSVV